MPGTAQSTFYTSLYFILTPVLQKRFYCPHSTEEETEITLRKWKKFYHGHLVRGAKLGEPCLFGSQAYTPNHYTRTNRCWSLKGVWERMKESLHLSYNNFDSKCGLPTPPIAIKNPTLPFSIWCLCISLVISFSEFWLPGFFTMEISLLPWNNRIKQKAFLSINIVPGTSLGLGQYIGTVIYILN